ncbi:MAG: hypothetical protein NZ772_09410 [Cyanobacteria bacterium]|nr:hypothetical protein [Cyanobacteriota bacterium]MDW8200902.1 hypothetical protein [Cyanobacteriota bacterium SKYGB_h_bin112]
MANSMHGLRPDSTMQELTPEGLQVDSAWVATDLVKTFNRQWGNRLADLMAHCDRERVAVGELDLESNNANLTETIELSMNTLQVLRVVTLLTRIIFNQVPYIWCCNDNDYVQG